MRKSKILFILSVLCLLVIVLTFIQLPLTLSFNILRVLLLIASIVLYILFEFYNNTDYIETSDKKIEDLREDYNNIYKYIETVSKAEFEGLDSDFKKKFLVYLDTDDDYLLDFDANIQSILSKSNVEEIKNRYMSVACVMDSLVSAWKIRTQIPDEIALAEDLIIINCTLAVQIAFVFLGIDYEKLKDERIVKNLIDLLTISYFDQEYGQTLTIEFEATILELIYYHFLNV